MDSTHVAGTVFELLAERARTVGPKPAVLAPNHPPLTYGMLHEQALQAGDEFARLGLGPGSRIAVALLDERDAAVAMLATMSWVTCVPLSVGSGAAGQEERLRQLRVDAVMVAEGDDGPLAAAARAAGLALIKVATAIDGGIELLAPCPDRAPGSTASQGRPDDVALLLQTSGTTGRSRAIPITHRALLCAGAGRSISAADRVMCVVPMRTSSGLRAGVIAPLAIGASTVIASGFDASRFFAWLDAFHPTAVLASPTVHSAILEEALQRKRALPGSVRFVRSSSNAMSAAMQERIEAVLGVPVIQGYGMTETGLISEDAPPPGRRRAGSVGVPRNVEIRIVDERGESAIAGGVGEILVRGPAVTRGYEDDPEANSSAFRDGWFRTGDLGCLDADGYLFIVGRCKELINRGGLKVAPAEVDGVLLRHPDVLDAATVAVPHPSLGEDVVTAVVLRDGAATAPAQLRAYASERLEPFKVPSAIVPVDELPRNALGKVRRAALAELVAKAMSTVHVPPRDAEERLVAGIFSCILHRPRVGALDNFFELGGDSLRAAQVFARVSEQAGVTMKPSTLFEAPTVEQLAQEVRKALACPMRSSASAPPLVRRAHRGVDATRGERGRSPTGVALD